MLHDFHENIFQCMQNENFTMQKEKQNCSSLDDQVYWMHFFFAMG